MKLPIAFLLALGLLTCSCGGEPEDDDGGPAVVLADGQQLTPGSSRLVRALERDEDGANGRLVEALARVAQKPDADAIPYLLTLSAHPNEEVRFSVVLALKAVGGDEAVEALSVMAADDESELVRLEAGED